MQRKNISYAHKISLALFFVINNSKHRLKAEENSPNKIDFFGFPLFSYYNFKIKISLL